VSSNRSHNLTKVFLTTLKILRAIAHPTRWQSSESDRTPQQSPLLRQSHQSATSPTKQPLADLLPNLAHVCTFALFSTACYRRCVNTFSEKYSLNENILLLAKNIS